MNKKKEMWEKGNSNLEINKYKDEIIELYKTNSIRQIAEIYGVSHHVISRRLDYWGIGKRNRENESRRRVKQDETRRKVSVANSGENNGMYGRRYKHTPETKKKQRLIQLKMIEDRCGQVMPNYNQSSISILEQRAKELGINDLQHAENGGEFHIKELGYWVDGYSKEKNIVIEYYEGWHKEKCERDEQRKQEIIEYLECEFIEIREWEN